MARFTQKQIDKYNRQKYIAELEKISKNIFKMLRDAKIDSNSFSIKLASMVKKLHEKEAIRLEGEYNQKLKEYILALYEKTKNVEQFNDIILNELREPEMSNLNRLQKLKNKNSYKKEKHKLLARQDDD
ncbi:MAG: hypothetical protein WC253_01870 [Sulfurovaceae bacterium]|nr:hypothetical protein [Sulfurovaceae bacterium]